MLETRKQVKYPASRVGNRASDYLKKRTNEVKEIMTMMAKVAQTVSERDQKYVGQFEQLGSRLESIANLEDLKAIRQSLSKSATGMKCRVDDMARDSRQAICSSTRNWAFTRRGWRRWNGSPSDRDFLSGPDNRQYVEHQLAFV